MQTCLWSVRRGEATFRSTHLPSFLLTESARARNRGFRRNGPRPAKHRQSSAVPVGGIDQPRVWVLESLARLPSDDPGRLVSRREEIADLAGKERVRDVPRPHSLVVPCLVEQARRPVVEPRLVDRLLPIGADELSRGEVEIVVDVRKAEIRDDLGMGQARDVDDAAEARRTIEDLIRLDDEGGVLVLVDDDGSRGMGCASWGSAAAPVPVPASLRLRTILKSSSWTSRIPGSLKSLGRLRRQPGQPHAS